ncbi:accessory gene regulator B [Clostridium aceticum]|uniref:Accessory gene regulator B n=1 Tax=Clostridium aceticum TaxID=84022 RepID=A0A0D8I604_9CLOT|nr:accessory gene regulator B family protein [Clostridium aceticum]AKL95834.1 accessory gene regulator B [Clostridium aceticum]KJF25452.1 accessory gene regulator AgrB [Clostridium aceticum]
MHNLIDIFAYKIYKEKLLSNSDIRKMKYAMKVIWSELEKFIIFLLFFVVLNKVPLFLFSFAVLLSIRSFSGGLHFENNLPCFITSFGFFSLTVFILPHLFTMTIHTALILTLVSIIIISYRSPRPSSFRPILNKKRKRILKYLSLFSTLLWIFVLFKFLLIYNKTFFACGIWSIFLQASQLSIGKEEKQ